MDPLTHAVIGISVSKITGNAVDISNPAAVGIIIGSIFPDIDIILQKWGDCVYLKNHRGFSHSVPGISLSAALISMVLCTIYSGSSFLSLFLYTLAGCFSHILFDIFNSYGAKILWPFSKKKFSLSLLLIFDPIFLSFLIAYIFYNGKVGYVFLGGLFMYLAIRALMRFRVHAQLKHIFGTAGRKISLLPSMTGLLRWYFVIEQVDCNIIGEKSFFNSRIKIFKKLNKASDAELDRALVSPVGKFFSDFTPLFHVVGEKNDGITRYKFIDMRYYVRNNFLHHAILEVDENDSILKATFNPYSINRSNEISC